MHLADALHAPFDVQRDALFETVRANASLMRLLDALPEGAWVGSGVIFQNVWNALAGLPWNTHVKDADILFFDADDLSPAREARVLEVLGPQDFVLDVVNVARVHLWYPKAFGKEIPAYRSIAESIATWPTIASALAIRPRGDDFDLIAPFGLHDTLAGWVRPNRVLIDAPVYEAKARRWSACWPTLRVWSWSGEEIRI